MVSVCARERLAIFLVKSRWAKPIQNHVDEDICSDGLRRCNAQLSKEN